VFRKILDRVADDLQRSQRPVVTHAIIEEAVAIFGAFSEQKRARPRGNAGIPGIYGNLESVTYRI
jgi:hypothetical protein